MTYRVAMTGPVDDQLCSHLLRADGDEDLCFALWRPSSGASRNTALIVEAVLPLVGERHVHGNASFESRYLLRATALAAQQECGLALLHSHPDAVGWQGMSEDDINAERDHAAQAMVVTGLPLVGLTLSGEDRTWSARFWTRTAPREYRAYWCENVRVVGSQLRISYNPELLPPPRQDERQARTVSAWGDHAQAELSRTRVGVIGLGSVGSAVAECLARIGIVHITLMDFDTLKEHNLDRCVSATREDLGQAKVAVAKHYLEKSSTASKPVIQASEFSIVEDAGFRLALDADVLFCCVDRPWPRAVLNLIAYAHLIPVVDGGIAIQAGRKGLYGAHWKAHIAAPGRKCLECHRQYDPGLVQAERDGYLDDPRYIEELPEEHEIRRNENVFPFSMNVASLEILQFLRMILAPLGISDVGGDDYQFVLGQHQRDESSCRNDCLYSRDFLARGDTLGVTVTGRHATAEAARRERAMDQNKASNSA
jgi:molybdopterin-synthase adenylyltransferase